MRCQAAPNGQVQQDPRGGGVNAHLGWRPHTTAARLRQLVSKEVAHMRRKLTCCVGLWLTRKLTYLARRPASQHLEPHKKD